MSATPPPSSSHPVSRLIAYFKGHPTGFYFFFWGELAERCSYYGMLAILTFYLNETLKFSEADSSRWAYYFQAATYLTPLIGGIIADRFLGKYWTIVGFSVPYVIAQLLIGIETDWIVMVALFLCAMGSRKSCRYFLLRGNRTTCVELTVNG